MEHPRWLSWTFMAFQWFPNVRHWTFPGKNRDRIFAICQMAQVWSKNLVRINLDRNLLSNPSISHMISIKNGDSCWFCYHWHSISYNISTSIIPFFIADMLLITHDIPQMAPRFGSGLGLAQPDSLGLGLLWDESLGDGLQHSPLRSKPQIEASDFLVIIKKTWLNRG